MTIFAFYQGSAMIVPLWIALRNKLRQRALTVHHQR